MIEIKIDKTNISGTVSATLKNPRKEGTGTIEIHTNQYLLVYLNEKMAYNEIKNAIAHELEHWYISYYKFINTGKPDNFITKIGDPKMYLDIVNLISKSQSFDIIYRFAYTIYNTFAQELNAFVSQCYGQVYDYLIQQKEITIDTVKDALKSSKIYNMFYRNKENIDTINSLNNKNMFINNFNKRLTNSDNYIKNIEELTSMINVLSDINTEAIRMCHRTAMNAYYDIIEKK